MFDELGTIVIIELLKEHFTVFVILFFGLLPIDFLDDFFLGDDFFIKFLPVLFKNRVSIYGTETFDSNLIRNVTFYRPFS